MNNQYIQKALPPPRSGLVEKCAQTFSKLFLSIKTIFLIYKSFFVLTKWQSLCKIHMLSDVITKAYASVAQLVEQWTENPCVAGSIPA